MDSTLDDGNDHLEGNDINSDEEYGGDEYHEHANEVDDDEIDENELLYDGAPLTVKESLLSVFTFSLRHSITGTCLADLLQLVSLHIPRNNKFTKTVYKFMKYFEYLKTPLVKHYYCRRCLSALEYENAECECTNRELCYFIELKISDQLQSLLDKPGFIENLSHQYRGRHKQSRDAIEDIYDGALYKAHVEKNNSEANIFTLSFMWYSDGAPIFKSRKYSLWPLYFIINELPYAERIKKENVLVAEIWFGESDPVPDLFLKPIYDQLAGFQVGKVLTTNDLEMHTVKAFLLCGTCDSPARADFLNHVRFNGEYGCFRCLSKGYSIRGENFGNTWIHSFEGNLQLRSKEVHE